MKKKSSRILFEHKIFCSLNICLGMGMGMGTDGRSDAHGWDLGTARAPLDAAMPTGGT